MRYLFIFLVVPFVFSCKRYKDPDPFTDGRIVNKYCNIPSAINYNWNFPGVEDNTTCVFPAQIYSGTYFYRDTTYNPEGAVSQIDSMNLYFTQLDSTHMTVSGFCGSKIFTAQASRFYKFTLDTIVGNGQLFCSNLDTISGSGSKLGLDDTTTIRMNFKVQTSTGVFAHIGVATKQ